MHLKKVPAYMMRSYIDEREVECIGLENVLMQLSRGGEDGITKAFECKTCGRRFTSFQALGGHRTSHKRPKLSTDEDTPVISKPKVHECSICGLEYATGQALGGHMRRHRAAEGGRLIGHGFVKKSSSANGKRVLLDLNFPPLEDDTGERRMLGLGLGLVY